MPDSRSNPADIYRAVDRMDEAKRAFSRAAVAALSGEPNASQLAAEALRAIEQARAGLAQINKSRFEPTAPNRPRLTIGDQFFPVNCTCGRAPWEPCEPSCGVIDGRKDV